MTSSSSSSSSRSLWSEALKAAPRYPRKNREEEEGAADFFFVGVSACLAYGPHRFKKKRRKAGRWG